MHRRLAHQRGVVGRDIDRDARSESARRSAGIDCPARPHQHRHVGPRDAVLEVRPSEQVGEVLGLGAFGVEG